MNLLDWAGGGQLQRADRVEGPWTTLATARSPFTVQSPVPATFYRVKHPRPVALYVPSSYDGQTPMPLVILLHGFGGSGQEVEDWMRFRPLAEDRGFLYCYPDGSLNVLGYRSWQATDYASDAAADLGGSLVDDAGYLRGVIEEIARRFAVDPKRIYVVGHSNGGAMAYRMACQSADLIAGIASIAAGTFFDPSLCAPSELVHILQIWGTDDVNAFYWGCAVTIAGGFVANMAPLPGAVRSVQTWAGYNGARDPVTDPGPSLDLDLSVPGIETVVTRYTQYPPGGAVELWTINGGLHRPTFSPEFGPRFIDWLLDHRKP